MASGRAFAFAASALCLLPFALPHLVIAGAGQAPAMNNGVVDVPGARLAYVDSGGSGIPVVLLHAATGSSRVWEYQVPAFTSAGYRVIAYDRRGFGQTTTSGGPASTAPDDLDALVAYLRLDRVHLVGTAAGGIVATDYALSFPARLRSLVIANSIVGVQDDDYLALGRRLRPKAFGDLPADFRELGPAYRAGNPAGTDRWLALEQSSRARGASPEPQPPKNHITFQALSTIRTPTLLITGDADLYAPPPAMDLVLQRIAGAETLVIPAVGHSAYWEQPDIFNQAVLSFIRRH
jgi:pimeloyl-ACP methyl ester carboxylesterase